MQGYWQVFMEYTFFQTWLENVPGVLVGWPAPSSAVASSVHYIYFLFGSPKNILPSNFYLSVSRFNTSPWLGYGSQLFHQTPASQLFWRCFVDEIKVHNSLILTKAHPRQSGWAWLSWKAPGQSWNFQEKRRYSTWGQQLQPMSETPTCTCWQPGLCFWPVSPAPQLCSSVPLRNACLLLFLIGPLLMHLGIYWLPSPL